LLYKKVGKPLTVWAGVKPSPWTADLKSINDAHWASKVNIWVQVK
jgi:hypothetical protein